MRKMELSDLNQIIISINSIWPRLEGEARNSLLKKRNELDDIASELTEESLSHSNKDLDEAISRLKGSMKKAKNLTQVLDEDEKITNEAKEIINDVVSSIGEVMKLLTFLA